MNYHEFKEELKERVKKEYAGADIYIETVGKNNGTRKERLVIREGGKRLVPCIRLNELYQCHGETGDMELCVKMVKQLAEPEETMIIPDRLWTWEECRGRILLRLISRGLEPGTPGNRTPQGISGFSRHFPSDDREVRGYGLLHARDE